MFNYPMQWGCAFTAWVNCLCCPGAQGKAILSTRTRPSSAQGKYAKLHPPIPLGSGRPHPFNEPLRPGQPPLLPTPCRGPGYTYLILQENSAPPHPVVHCSCCPHVQSQPMGVMMSGTVHCIRPLACGGAGAVGTSLAPEDQQIR